MGFAASQARYIMLTARRSDLELQGQFINQARLYLGNIVGSLFSASANMDPESPETQQLQARIASIQQMDKALEIQLNRLDTQRQAIVAEIDSVKKVIQTNIEMSFKTFA